MAVKMSTCTYESSSLMLKASFSLNLNINEVERLAFFQFQCKFYIKIITV